jgi:hypothetical protein
MTEVMKDGFNSLSDQEMNLIDGGGWVEVGQAFVGSVLIGLSPVIGVGAGLTGGPVVGIAAGLGIASIGSNLIGAAAH